MAYQRYRLRSELPNLNETQGFLNYIAAQYAQVHTRVVFQIGLVQFNASNCTNVVITGTGTTNNIQFQRPGSSTVEYYNLVDIEDIRRLRTKKHKIFIKANATSTHSHSGV